MISRYSSMVGDYRKEYNTDCMKTAIKAYKDRTLTGLTEEEEEIIRKEIITYINENPIKTQADLDAFRNFKKGLLRSLGFKGDTDEYAIADVLDGMLNDAEVGEKSAIKKQRIDFSALAFMSPQDFLGTREMFYIKKDD